MHISAVKSIQSVSDRKLRGCWCDINVLNVHAPIEDKTDYVKDNFYEELACGLRRFPLQIFC